MLSVKSCPVEEFFNAPASAELLAGYAAEASIEGMPPYCPDRKAYLRMSHQGFLRVLGAYEDDSLVGVLVLLLTVYPHYSALVGTVESYFVAPESRRTGAGLALLRAAESMAKQAGAVALLLSAPAEGRLDEVAPRVGYRKVSHVHFKALR